MWLMSNWKISRNGRFWIDPMLIRLMDFAYLTWQKRVITIWNKKRRQVQIVWPRKDKHLIPVMGHSYLPKSIAAKKELWSYGPIWPSRGFSLKLVKFISNVTSPDDILLFLKIFDWNKNFPKFYRLRDRDIYTDK